MTRDDDFIGQLESYLDDYEGSTPLSEDVRDAIRAQLPLTQQRPAWWPTRRLPEMNRALTLGLAAAAVVLVAMVGIYFVGPRVGGPTDATPSPSAAESGAPTRSSPEPSASMLPGLGLPGARGGPPGEYGWAGSLGSRAGMHRIVESRQTQLVFAVENDCFADGVGSEPVAIAVAGLDGLYVEPYEDPGVLFMPAPQAGETTGAYALAIGDRTLCVYLTWDAATTQVELDAARQVVESIRGQPLGQNGIRINFSTTGGWDTG